MNDKNPYLTDMSKEDALRAYARMMHSLSVEDLEPYLAADLHYTSAWVEEEIQSKDHYLSYIRPKLSSIKRTGSRVWAEMCWLPDSRGPYLLLAQGDQENVISTVCTEVQGPYIRRFDMRPITTIDGLGRTGEYPT
jgi:hypothetical protein